MTDSGLLDLVFAERVVFGIAPEQVTNPVILPQYFIQVDRPVTYQGNITFLFLVYPHSYMTW